MEIIINRPNNDDLLEQNKIKWKLFTNRNIFLFVYAFMGTFFLVGNWLTLKDGENFWGFISSFGLSLIFLSLFYFSHIYQNKIKYLSRTKQLLSRYKNQNEGRHEMFGGGQPHAILVMDAKCLYDWLDYTRFPYSHYSTRRGNVPDSTVKLHWVS